MTSACTIRVRGVVQGVGFRPFVYRLARDYELAGWVLNGEQGVEIFAEGSHQRLDDFVAALRSTAPPAAMIAELTVRAANPAGLNGFAIRESEHHERPSVRISPDLAVCEDCISELFDPADPRFHYAYINCTNCGPRYSVILELPYDRPHTTMKDWPLDPLCAEQYHDALNRRFHAQPIACPKCGPAYYLRQNDDDHWGADVLERSADLLRSGRILAVKGIGGYHLACDARNANAVQALRERKFRKEKPFALMASTLSVAREVADLSDQAERLMASPTRPIVISPGRIELEQVAPGNHDFGIMLPYTPLHHLLFAAGAPDLLVFTSANRSNEPIAYEDQEAFRSLAGVADAFLVGQRPIARRVEDSVVRAGAVGPMILRRARGFAPGAVATLPTHLPILALGADLKNAITLVVDGEAFLSQFIGDLEHLGAFSSFQETIDDLLAMYEISHEELLIVHDAHPQYRSTLHAARIPRRKAITAQHHRAHVASVLAERGAWEQQVLGFSFDGTGYGDDGNIWGGEMFVGSLANGLIRVAHLRSAVLPGGDAAAIFPVQAAAGFLYQVEHLPDLCSAPFHFPSRYSSATELIEKRVRTFTTTSVGRLFDAAAALLGFTREITFEGQAAIWLEDAARRGRSKSVYPFPFSGEELDFRPLLREIVRDRVRGAEVPEIARRFQRSVATGVANAARALCAEYSLDTVVLSGGVFQNSLLLDDLAPLLQQFGLKAWTNQAVPANDGGISLGQAALAAFEEAR